MSEFIIVIPEGWIQLDWQYITNNISGMDYQGVVNAANSDIEERLKSGGIIPLESSLVEYKLIDDTYFMIRLG